MPNPDETQLLRLLGCDPRSGTRAASGPESSAATFDADAVSRMREALLANPDAMLADAPAVLGSTPKVEDALRLLNSAESALRNARGTAEAVQANLSDEAYELPPAHRFPGYDHKAIPIHPSRTQFENVADAPAWAVTAVAAWFYRRATPRPKLPVPKTDAVYPLLARDNATTVVLFSDWGTGYYHSRYIAAHIERMRAAQAIHLGDTYYIGSQSQYDTQVTPILEPLLRQMPVYLLNANHEMDSQGIPYLAYLRYKGLRGIERGFTPQPQETSYFCLVNDRYQVVGIDTAFYGAGRYRDRSLRAWLQARLDEGRAANRTTILLSQNEPYAPEDDACVAARRTLTLARDDLRPFIDAGLIHAWFWGDEHYTALYEANDRMPFVGSCIGHGGYPFGRRRDDSGPADVARTFWADTASRFDGIRELRQDRGNNGFCHLTLDTDRVVARYIDWRFRTRLLVALRRDGDRLRIEAEE